MKKVLLTCAAAACIAGIALPAQAQIPVPGRVYPGGVYVAPPAPVYVAPPPRYEPIPNPRPGYNWTPGYWQPYDGRHRWIAGRWAAVPGYAPGYAPGYVYRDPGWRERQWERRQGNRDSDHDGVPNRYDRRPNNPYRY